MTRYLYEFRKIPAVSERSSPTTDDQLADSCFVVDIALEVRSENRLHNL